MQKVDYSYVKSIRFNLEDSANNDLNKITGKFLDSSYKENEFNFNLIEELIDKFKTYFFQKKDLGDKDYILKTEIKIKKFWLKIYFKEGWDFKNKRILGNKVSDEIAKLFFDFKSKLLQLKDSLANNKEKSHLKIKNSFFSFVLQKLLSKKYFYALKDLVIYSENKNSDEFKDNLISLFGNLEKYLKYLEKKYSPSQGIGLEILRGTFNFYTLNKTSKNYSKDLIKCINNLKKEKNKKILRLKPDRIEAKGLNFSLKRNDLRVLKQVVKKLGVKTSFNLADSKKFLKLFKSELKKKLYNDFENPKNRNFDEFKDYSCLFNSNEILKDIFSLSKEIQDSDSKNKEKLKKERGKLLNSFKNWKKYNKFYREISKKLGKIDSMLKGFEKEKFESQKVNYWCLLYKENMNYYILFIPKEKRSEFKNYLTKKKEKTNAGSNLFELKSLTMRALHKLVFNEHGSFFQEMNEKMKNEIKSCKKLITPEKEEKTLKILKEVLKSSYAKTRLDLIDFDLENSDIYSSKTLNEFENKLESNCYKIKSYRIKKSDLRRDFPSVFYCKVNSYDLEKRFENEYQTPKSKYKRHTCDYWMNFVNNLENSNVRLNPEIRVNFKEKDSKLEEFLHERYGLVENDLKGGKFAYNRNLNNKFIINFTFLVNAGRKFLDLGFADFDEIKKEIYNFNKNLNDSFTNSYFCGIDIGEVELASLAFYKFNKTQFYVVDGKKFFKPILPTKTKIKCFRLKKKYFNKLKKPSHLKVNFKDVHEKQIISNISYFDDQRDLFEQISPFALDLTCAKVVNGKIIENADVLTYLQYLKKLAKRRLHDVYSNNKFSDFKNYYLDWEFEKDSINYKTNNLVLKHGGKKISKNQSKIFTFIYKYEGIKTKHGLYEYDVMKEYFEKYLQDLKNLKNSDKKKDKAKDVSVPMLNNLRDALVSNIIGVLSILKTEFDFYVVLEDEESKNEEDKFIIKRLELALYKNFQTQGMVPPQIKQLMKIREQFRSENEQSGFQIGNVLFVNSKNTSKSCPFCGETENKFNHKAPKISEYILNKNNSSLYGGHFSCISDVNSCGFSTIGGEDKKLDEFKILNNNDSVAAYNIAKKGFNFINKLKSNGK